MPLDVITAGDANEITTALAEAFADAHGRAPAGVYAAPGRVNLIGEHVDYNGGRCLPVALPHATYAAISPREDDLVTVRSLQQEQPWTGRLEALGPGQVDGWVSYVAGVVWALQQQGLTPPGLDVVLTSTVPVGAGLSSSAALECAVALGVLDLTGGTLDDEARAGLAEACVRAENEVAGAATGGMDQAIALFAQAGHALLLDTRDGSRRQVPWQPEGVDLLVVDTRAAHELNDGGYESRRRSCEQAAKVLGVDYLRDVTDADAALAALDDEVVRRRVRHVLTEMARVEEAVRQIEAGDVEGLGRTFLASHASLRDDYEVSCEELDLVVDTATAHGALGARMTGGGFGGSAIALVPHGAVGAVEQAVARAFADHGLPAPGFLQAEPAGGAHRIR
ncbi:MAG: galactokinase [Nocardioidaceae bacterium]